VGTNVNSEEASVQSNTDHQPNQSLIHARDVVSGYGDLQVLFGVDVEVTHGELVMIFGPNGSGKSTFIKTIAGIQPAWEGRIQIRGEDITEVPAENRASHGLG